MNEKNLDIAELLILQKERPLTEQEQLILDNWSSENPENEKLLVQIHDEQWIEKEVATFAQYDAAKSRAILEARVSKKAPVHRVQFLRTAWFKYAAAILIIIGLGAVAYLWNTQNVKRETSNVKEGAIAVQDVAPGGNRATLTLANGKKIVLDSVANGLLAQEGVAAISKTNEGKVVYDAGGVASGEPTPTYNTLTTPRGGQYQLQLPDGSRVWLNAASSITYPTAFTQKERKVTVTGEAYFEVAKHKSKPFIVATEQLQVRVLGTHFNVNAYEDEGGEKVTLAEGSVTLAPLRSSAPLSETKLTPGQQVVFINETSPFTIHHSADLEQVLAWKNGLFNFSGADLQTVMQQLERWYDIEVEYRGTPAQYRFKGKLQRNLTLGQVIRILGEVGVKFNIQGRKLIVTQ